MYNCRTLSILFSILSINRVTLIAKKSLKATKIVHKERLQYYIIDKHFSSLKNHDGMRKIVHFGKTLSAADTEIKFMAVV